MMNTSIMKLFMKKTVYLSEVLAESAYNRLKKNFNIVSDFNNPEKIDGIITRKISITREILSKTRNCKIVANHGTGVDQIDCEAAAEFEIPVVSAPGLNAQSVAELTLGFIISLSYKMKFCDSGMQQGKFEKFGLPELQGTEVSNKKLGLIGSGYIAKALAELMKTAFNADIYCYNPHRSEDELKALGFKKIDSIKELLKICDFVSVHVPLNEDTKDLINSENLSSASPNLILVNTSRGGIINEDDLYDALVNHKIKAAACDVFEQEPPAKDSKLLSLPNFIGTLHVGGSTAEALERVSNKTVDNIESYLL